MDYDNWHRRTVAAPSASYLEQNIGGRLLATSITCAVITTLFLGLRYWARRIQRTQTRFDDILIVLSWIVILGLCAAVIIDVEIGDAGRHREFVFEHISHYVAWLKITLIVIPTLYIAAIALPKLALMWMFLNLFTGRKSRWTCYVFAGITIVTALVEIPFVIFQCQPLDFLWEQYTEAASQPQGTCFNPMLIFRYGMLPFIITDVLILIIPGTLIWRLQISLKVRISIIATLGLKTIGVVCSFVRLPALFQAVPDSTWDTVWFLIWTTLEPTCYFVAVCVVSSRPLARYIIFDSPVSPAVLGGLRLVGIQLGDKPAPPLPPKPTFVDIDPSKLGSFSDGASVTTTCSACPEESLKFPPVGYEKLVAASDRRPVVPPVYTPDSKKVFEAQSFV